MMRLGIITSSLRDDNAARGVGKYTQMLIDSLIKANDKIELVTGDRAEELMRKVDLIHFPFFDPFFLTLPYFRDYPTVVTVHDLIPIACKEHFQIGIKGWLKWQVQRLALKRVNLIFTDSLSSQNDIMKFVGVDARTQVVSLYVDSKYRLQAKEVIEVVRKNYQLPRRYLLYVGDVNWNKNILGILRVFVQIKKVDEYQDVKLILVGKAFKQKTLEEVKDINKLIGQLNLEKEIVKLGYVNEGDLPMIYAGASVYLQLSWAEGFGLPVLEAMSSGAIVLGADRSSLKEISGPAALVDPEKPEEVARTIIKCLQMNQRERENWQQRALEWVKKFSEQKFRQEMIAGYESVHQRG